MTRKEGGLSGRSQDRAMDPVGSGEQGQQREARFQRQRAPYRLAFGRRRKEDLLSILDQRITVRTTVAR